jgi:hypothetical protein
MPEGLSFAGVVLAWALILSAVTTTLSVPARFALYGSRLRARRRYTSAYTRSKPGEVPEIDQVVGLVVIEMLVVERIEALLAVFGGRLIVLSPMEISLNVRQLSRVGVLAGAVSAALLTWPAHARWRPEEWWTTYVDWNAVRLALPVIIVIIVFVGIVVVVPRAPLLDRIRARDEAAKDANRLLARWSYAASRLSGVLQRRALELHDLAPQLVSDRLGKLHAALGYVGGQLTDARDDGTYRTVAVRRHPLMVRDALVVAPARQPLRALNADICEAGLGDVARGLIPSVWPFVMASGEYWALEADVPSGAVERTEESFEAWPLRRLTTASVDLYDLARRGSGVGISAGRERLEAQLRDIDLQVRLSAVEMYLHAACLSVAHNKLSRRLLGSSWTRLLSAAKS